MDSIKQGMVWIAAVLLGLFVAGHFWPDITPGCDRGSRYSYPYCNFGSEGSED